MVRKARLDANRTAKPLTEIKAVHKAGECVKPGIGADAYIVASTCPRCSNGNSMTEHTCGRRIIACADCGERMSAEAFAAGCAFCEECCGAT